ncbi:MAG: HD domain-containing phosphohydrolase [Pseudomonadota bacterium]
MSESTLNNAVNRHYLDKLLALAENMEVLATEDIFDAHSKKLLAKGTRLLPEHREILGSQKLKKPLEACVALTGAVDTALIVATAARLINFSAPLGRILRASQGAGPSPLAMLAEMEFGNATSTMLTIAKCDGVSAFEHTVTVALLSICMAKKLRLTEADQMTAGLAGMLHDIGELYVDPAYLAHDKRLQPHEWAHIVAHPRIGQMLVNELESFPLAVGRAVFEHHERFDGSGYPRQRKGNNISPAGQAVAAAELIAGVLHKDRPLERAELALKIMPGEFAHELVSAISSALRMQESGHGGAQPEFHGAESVERLFWRIASAIETGNNLLDGSTAKSPLTRELLAQAIGRIETIERAFISTGLDAYLDQGHELPLCDGGTIAFEKAVATREIQWRLRDIARDLALHSATPDQKSIFAPLIHLLDDDTDSPLKLTPPKAEPKPVLRALAPTSFAGSQPYGA